MATRPATMSSSRFLEASTASAAWRASWYKQQKKQMIILGQILGFWDILGSAWDDTKWLLSFEWGCLL